MHKGFLKIAAILGMLTVVMGAFAAHSLKGKISDHALSTFETGVRYQFYHLFALFLTGIIYKEFTLNTTRWAGRLFLAGIFLFCGSLYYLAFMQAVVQPAINWVGVVTPVGGLFFISGWILLCISFFNKRSPKAL